MLGANGESYCPQNQSRSHVAEKRLCLASWLGINYYRNGKNDDLARLCCVSHESTQSRSFLLSLQLYCSSHPSRYMTIESPRTDLFFLNMIVFCSFLFLKPSQRTAVSLPVMPLPKGSLVALVTPMTAEGQV